MKQGIDMNVSRTFRILTLAIAGSIAVASGLAGAAEAVAKVNGVVIQQSKLDLLVKAAMAQGQPDSPEMRSRIKDELVTEKSEDTGSKGKGGDLDWAPPNRYVKSFSDALAKLKKGQMTDTPVQSPFGWHVIRLDDERPFKAPGFDEVKAAIHQQLQQQAVQKAVADLRAKAKIE